MSLPNSYAQALFLAATDSGLSERLPEIEAQLQALAGGVNVSADLRRVLHAPITSTKEKQKVLTALAEKQAFHPLVTQFLLLLAKKGRLSVLPLIIRSLRQVRLLAQGMVLGTIVSAEPIGEDEVLGLAKSFSQKLGKKVAFDVQLDPGLMAGLRVTVNGVTYDGSLKAQIQRLRDRLLETRSQ